MLTWHQESRGRWKVFFRSRHIGWLFGEGDGGSCRVRSVQPPPIPSEPFFFERHLIDQSMSFDDEVAGVIELANRYRALHGEDTPLVLRRVPR